jgi:hypothetical protein
METIAYTVHYELDRALFLKKHNAVLLVTESKTPTAEHSALSLKVIVT